MRLDPCDLFDVRSLLSDEERAIVEAATHDEAARFNFLTHFNRYLSGEIGRGNRIAYETRVLPAFRAAHGRDPEHRYEIRDAMKTVMSGRTTIVIAHRPGTIALADRVILLDEGKVAAIGTHDELVGSNARYREVLASMSVPEDEKVG